MNVCIVSYFASSEDSQRGPVDDPLDYLREVVAYGLPWLWLYDWLQDDVSIEICDILCTSAVKVY